MTRRARGFVGACLILLLLLAPLRPAIADALIEQAKALLQKKDAKGAYALLEPHESQRAGDTEFDFVFGLAALDAGQPSRAVFALERVLALQPDNALARAEIARAYFQLGERDVAKEAFQAVQKMDVPSEAQATIQKFLGAIEQIEATERTQVKSYVELGVGYDSNVNSATSASQVAVPLFGGAIFTLTSQSVQNHDTYTSLGAGLNVRHPVDRELALFGGAVLNKRVNSSEDRFDTGYSDLNAGVAFTRNKNVITGALQANNYYVDNNRFRDAYGATVQWQYNHDARNQSTLFGQYTDLQYPGQDVRDAKRYVVGAAYAHALTGDLQPVFYVGAYGGQERERAAGVPHLGHDLVGIRLGGQIRPSSSTTLFVNASAERRDYGGADPFFLVTREDKQYDLRIGVNYVPAKAWVVSPLLSVVRNKSNVAINDFRREMLGVTLRREF